MYALGIDIGSATTKVLLLSNKTVSFAEVVPTHPDPSQNIKTIEKIISQHGFKLQDLNAVTSTGYGRANVPFATKVVTEISCHAKGAHYLFPSTRTIIDIGGQDSKIIWLDEEGRVVDFQMNEKCAAGTGRFLENMARVLNVDLAEMGSLSGTACRKVQISSICTVFAESEVISQISQGTPRVEVIAGLHDAISDRIFAMAGRLGARPDIVMTGGVAKNQGVVKSLEKKFGYSINVPENPQIMGALGAALIAQETIMQKTAK
ncbi:acyl-CoA dehydratase activase [Paradesulfitobacterium aromaticivorans]